MANFRIITSDYKTVIDRLVLPESFYAEAEKEKILITIQLDLPRTRYISNIYTAKSIQKKLLAAEDSWTNYTQGNFDARCISETFVKYSPMYGPENHDCSTIGVAYIDDNGNNSGFAITYLKPDAANDKRALDFTISVINNTTAKPEKRKVTAIFSSNLWQKAEEIPGARIDKSAIAHEVSQALNSKAISELISGLINKDGSISIDLFSDISKRISANSNIDNRDEKKIELSSIIDRASKTLPNSSAFIEYLKGIKEHADNDINFYKDEYFNHIKDHISLMRDYQESLNEYDDESMSPNEKKLYKQGLELLDCIKTEALSNKKSLPALNMALKYCAAALENPTDKQSIQKIAELSQDCSRKASSFLKKLGAALLVFAGAVLIAAGILAVIPSGGSSLLLAVLGATGATAGIGFLTQGSKEKDMTKSVSQFKKSLTDIQKKDERPSDLTNNIVSDGPTGH